MLKFAASACRIFRPNTTCTQLALRAAHSGESCSQSFGSAIGSARTRACG
jgi:hypothetical protein